MDINGLKQLARQVPEEILWLKQFIRYKARTIVEIGSKEGGSLAHWIDLKPNVLISIEPRDMPYWDILTIAARENGVSLAKIEGKSQDEETLNRLHYLVGDIDFLFIDGDHTYESIWEDVGLYWPRMLNGGYMAIHDIASGTAVTKGRSMGVQRVWEEIKQTHTYWECVSRDPSPYPWPLGIGVIKCVKHIRG